MNKEKDGRRGTGMKIKKKPIEDELEMENER